MEIGIDLGTTNSCVAYVNQDGKPEVIPNSEGGRTTPSVIFFEDEGVVVGNAAKEEALISPEDTVSYIKRHMGEPSYKFSDKNHELFSPEELSAIILKKMKKSAEDFLGEEVTEAVITVPAYFTDAQRKATQDAGNMAGLKILKIINEPTAAALAYGINQNSQNQNIMIYDLGGGTFDVVIMELKDGNFRVIATNGNRELGGFDFDNALLAYVLNYVEEKHNVDLSEDVYAIEDLREKVEEAKKALSSKAKTNIIINSDGVRDKIEITLELFNSLIEEDVKKTLTMMMFTLEDADMIKDDIDKTIFVGGSSRMKLVREMVEEFMGKKPSFELNPDEVVAMGAAIQAHLLKGADTSDQNIKGVNIIDVNSHALGTIANNVDSGKEENCVIIPKNSPLPASFTASFNLVEDNQDHIKIRICEGEDKDIEYVNIIGETDVQLPQAQRSAGAGIEITFSYDVNGIICVDVLDVTTGIKWRVEELERKANLSKQEVMEKANKINNLNIE